MLLTDRLIDASDFLFFLQMVRTDDEVITSSVSCDICCLALMIKARRLCPMVYYSGCCRHYFPVKT
jgi:hypothetical protein